jgi:RNase H-fold protein (predicted Holliday junction resolvase)
MPQNGSKNWKRGLGKEKGEYNITYIPKFTLDQGEETTQEPQNLNKITRADQAIIVLGTNHTRKEEDGKATAKRIKKMTKEIHEKTRVDTSILQLPPQNTTEAAAAETTLANIELEKDDLPRGIKVIKLKGLKAGEDLERDGFHISRKGAEKIAKLVLKSLPKKTTTPICEIEINTNIAGHILGKKDGKKVKDLERDNDVRITINNSNNKLEIHGENAEKALPAVEEHVRNMQEIADKFEKNKHIDCRYLKTPEGCRLGARCSYRHEKKDEYNRERSRGRSNNRTESQRERRDQSRWKDNSERDISRGRTLNGNDKSRGREHNSRNDKSRGREQNSRNERERSRSRDRGRSPIRNKARNEREKSRSRDRGRSPKNNNGWNNRR